jgi:hypothetical protein
MAKPKDTIGVAERVVGADLIPVLETILAKNNTHDLLGFP